MTRYRVILLGTADVKQVQDVTADTPEEAANLAADDDSNHVWKYQGIRTIETANVIDHYTGALIKVVEVPRI